MAAKFFGQYLLEKGAITREQLMDAIQFQKSIHKPLCALAVDQGFLASDHLEKLDYERSNSDKKFLEIVARERMLSFEQLEELSRIQSERWLFLGEALVQRKHLTLVQLGRLFDDYKLQRTDGVSIDSIGEVIEKDLVMSLLKVTIDIFVHYTKQIVKVSSVEEGSYSFDDTAYVFSQEIKGDKKFVYAVALPEDLAKSIASYMLEEDVVEVGPAVLDAVSEFINIVTGNGCAKLSMAGYKVTACPPKVLAKELVHGVMSDHGSTVVVLLKTTKGEFKVIFSFRM